MKKFILGLIISMCIISIAFSSAIKKPVVTEVNTSTYTEITNTSEYCRNFSIWLKDGTQFRYSPDGTDENSAYSPDGSVGVAFPNSSVFGASVIWIKAVSGTVDCVFQPGN